MFCQPTQNRNILFSKINFKRVIQTKISPIRKQLHNSNWAIFVSKARRCNACKTKHFDVLTSQIACLMQIKKKTNWKIGLDEWKVMEIELFHVILWKEFHSNISAHTLNVDDWSLPLKNNKTYQNRRSWNVKINRKHIIRHGNGSFKCLKFENKNTKIHANFTEDHQNSKITAK